MPRLKNAEPFGEVGRLLRGYDLSAAALAGLLGVSEPTARRRLREPESFTLSELRKIARGTDVPADEIREAIKF